MNCDGKFSKLHQSILSSAEEISETCTANSSGAKSLFNLNFKHFYLLPNPDKAQRLLQNLGFYCWVNTAIHFTKLQALEPLQLEIYSELDSTFYSSLVTNRAARYNELHGIEPLNYAFAFICGRVFPRSFPYIIIRRRGNDWNSSGKREIQFPYLTS